MNRVHEYLLESGFVRTINQISKPVVVHSVAGAGKSTFFRGVITKIPNTQAFPLAAEDNPNLSSNRIRSFRVEEIDQGRVNILLKI
nr:truncated triple gene block protein 1 [Banana virus X]